MTELLDSLWFILNTSSEHNMSRCIRVRHYFDYCLRAIRVCRSMFQDDTLTICCDCDCRRHLIGLIPLYKQSLGTQHVHMALIDHRQLVVEYIGQYCQPLVQLIDEWSIVPPLNRIPAPIHEIHSLCSDGQPDVTNSKQASMHPRLLANRFYWIALKMPFSSNHANA